jgi:hypothetical protein
MSAPLRLAVVATPRSGNTWVRSLLHHVYALPVFAVDDLSEALCDALPAEAVVQVHWRRTPEFADRLRRHGFRVITVARHPLDVLVSILHFSWYAPETRDWLLGEGGNEDWLRAAMPRCRPFVDYCTGPRAAALLGVTPDWWDQPDVTRVRYERMVADPLAGLTELLDRFGPPRGTSVSAVLDKCSLDTARSGSVNNHFWKGQPGLWRSLLPAAEAGEILEAVRPECERLGYTADPDATLSDADADANWLRLTGQELTDTVRRTTVGFRAEVDRLHAAVAREHAALLATTAERDALRQELAELVVALTARRPTPLAAPPPAMQRHLGESAARIERLYSLQGLSVKLAAFVQSLRDGLRLGRRVSRGRA